MKPATQEQVGSVPGPHDKEGCLVRRCYPKRNDLCAAGMIESGLICEAEDSDLLILLFLKDNFTFLSLLSSIYLDCLWLSYSET